MFISGLNASKQVSEFQTNPLEVIYGNIVKKFLQVTDIIILTSDCDQREVITVFTRRKVKSCMSS